MTMESWAANIDETLAALRQAWLRNPDQRLCQLIVNAANPRTPCPELFYLEDQVLLERLKPPPENPA
jgi:hypothetical protein